jgi:hypothetical protein
VWLKNNWRETKYKDDMLVCIMPFEWLKKCMKRKKQKCLVCVADNWPFAVVLKWQMLVCCCCVTLQRPFIYQLQQGT